MDVIREREEKINLERQLMEEQKIRVLVQKRIRREKRLRRNLQEQLDVENRRRSQLEDALRAAGASEQISIINEKLSQEHKPHQNTGPPPTSSAPPMTAPQMSSSGVQPTEMRADRIKQEREDPPTSVAYGPPPGRDGGPPPPPENKPWGYAGMDMINTGVAFWQNYSDSLAQELEMERKSRQQQVEREVKSPLQDRSGYYKNSVMFTSTAI